MRLYILELSKYGIALILAVYTCFSFWMLFRSRDKQEQKVLGILQVILILLFQAAAGITLTAGCKDLRYLFFMLLQVVIVTAVIILFHTLYEQANMLLFHNMCMLMSIGYVIISRLSLTEAVKQFVIAALGMVIALVLPAFRKHFDLLKTPGYLYALIGILVLMVVLVLGSETLGANLSFTILGLTFQPSEFVKILFLLFIASVLRERSDFRTVLPAAALCAFHVLILVASRDLGSSVIFFVTCVLMIFLASGNWIYLILGILGGGAGSYIAYRLFAHVQVRVQAWLDPWSVIDSMGYQITQSLFSISYGGAFGAGLTQGTPEKIPYVEKDFIFAPVAEELGLIAAVCLIMICLNCFLVMLFMSLNYADRFCQLLTFGAAVEYGFQTFLTIGGETKFIPLTGVTLPFVSYGGSSILASIIIFTLVEIMAINQGERIEEFRLRFERKMAREEQWRIEEASRRRENGRRRRREEQDI